MVEISLDLLNDSLSRVGKKELEAEELKAFALDTLRHETKNLKERAAMCESDEIKENDINKFDFFTDKYHYGVFIQLSDDALYSVGKDKDGNDTQVKQLPKKVKGIEERDADGEIILTDRCYMRLKTRVGGMSVFLGLDKVGYLDTEKAYVLIGGMTSSHKVANSDEFHKEKKKGIEYSNTYYTFNLWQITQITKKGKAINVNTNFDCNWKKEEKKG